MVAGIKDYLANPLINVHIPPFDGSELIVYLCKDTYVPRISTEIK